MSDVMTAKIGPFTVWQALVLAVLMIALGGAAFVAVQVTNNSEAMTLAEDEQAILVARGDLVNAVSVSGSVVFPDRETIRFGVAGEVKEVLVNEGDFVIPGQMIALLDARTIANLEMGVAEARLSLRDAQDVLDGASASNLLAMAKAEQAVASASFELQNAEESLADLLAVEGIDGLAQAESAVTVAALGLADQQTRYGLTLRDNDGTVAAAVGVVGEVSAAYAQVFSTWLGVQISDVDPTLGVDAQLAALGADLDTLFSDQTDPPRSEETGLALDDPSTPWNETTIDTLLTFYPTPWPVVATCIGGETPVGSFGIFTSVCVRAKMDDASAALSDATDALLTAELDRSQALRNRDDAIDRASETLTMAVEERDALLDEGDSIKVRLARANVEVARENLAEADLALVQRGTRDLLAVELLESKLVVAEQSLVDAKDQLASSSLTSSISGVVATLSVEVGDSTSPGVFAEVVSQSSVELSGEIDQVDVLSMQAGILASVMITALPGQTLTGVVTNIGNAVNQAGVVTYPITITLQVPPGVSLMEGLSAAAEIVIGEQLDVLLIPTASVFGSFVAPEVRIINNGTIEAREIQLGLSDDFWVVVTGGVAEGEQVVMAAPRSGDVGFSGGLRALFGSGGGFGGGSAAPVGGFTRNSQGGQ